MQITRKSMLSGKVHTFDLDVTKEQLRAFANGVLVQDAFPHLNSDEREFLLTGITADEWVATFGGDDADED